jgi:hypothetical protein
MYSCVSYICVACYSIRCYCTVWSAIALVLSLCMYVHRLCDRYMVCIMYNGHHTCILYTINQQYCTCDQQYDRACIIAREYYVYLSKYVTYIYIYILEVQMYNNTCCMLHVAVICARTRISNGIALHQRYVTSALDAFKHTLSTAAHTDSKCL